MFTSTLRDSNTTEYTSKPCMLSASPSQLSVVHNTSYLERPPRQCLLLKEWETQENVIYTCTRPIVIARSGCQFSGKWNSIINFPLFAWFWDCAQTGHERFKNDSAGAFKSRIRLNSTWHLWRTLSFAGGVMMNKICKIFVYSRAERVISSVIGHCYCLRHLKCVF